MLISAWVALILAIPVLLLGEWIVRRVSFLSRFNIPPPVVGGLLVSVVLLLVNISGMSVVQFGTRVSERWWTWLVTTELEWAEAPAKNANLPFLVGFFTCIGLNASWTLVRRAGGQVAIFLAITIALAVCQNLVGLGLAKAMGAPPLLGLMCGSASQVGGHGTALGFAPEFAKAGLPAAAVVGAAAATFGIIAGSSLGGPLAGALIRRRKIRPTVSLGMHLEGASSGSGGILADARALAGYGRVFLIHLLLVLVCIKAGAWVSHFIQQTGIAFPVYMGALLLGVLVRNIVDLRGQWIRTEVIDTIGSVMLGWFLSAAMLSLNLAELAHAALPMLVILSAQALVMALFAWYITFRFVGRDYDAAVMAGGQCGFGLGAMPNAIATMKSLVETFGPAPRAFLVVPIVGSFLVDLFNAFNITFFLNLHAR